MKIHFAHDLINQITCIKRKPNCMSSFELKLHPLVNRATVRERKRFYILWKRHTVESRYNEPRVQRTSRYNEPRVQRTSRYNQPRVQRTSRYNEPRVQRTSRYNEPRVQRTSRYNEPRVQRTSRYNEPRVQRTSRYNEPKCLVSWILPYKLLTNSLGITNPGYNELSIL